MPTTTVTVGEEAAPLNFAIRRGDSIPPIDLTWPTGTDLSDRQWDAQARGDLDEGPLVATFTVDVTQAASGILTVSLTATQSRLLVTGTTNGRPTKGKGLYYWDLQATNLTDPDDVFTWIAGTITVNGDATVLA